MGDVAAFMDLGTNSVRMNVIRVNPNRTITVLNKLKQMVRLGEGAFKEKFLQPEPMSRTVAACVRFATVARAHGARTIHAVATSAARDAENGSLLVRRLRKEAGIDMRIISGQEEARLIFMGVVSGVDLGNRRALLLDIGGGSTELSVGTAAGYEYLDSLKLGAVRVTNLIQGDPELPVSRAVYAKMRRFVLDSSGRTRNRLRSLQVDCMIGSSGTVSNLAEICAHGHRNGHKPPAQLLHFADLVRMREHLCDCTLEERRRTPGINPERADIIVGGAVILETLMESFGIEEIAVSDRGLSEGLIQDWLARKYPNEWRMGGAVRERSVLHLGRSCGFEEPHARTVRAYATQLFDSARDAGLHELDGSMRELLEFAAMLHDIGVFLSFSNHHQHSHYLIRNAELLGFDRVEVEIMALAALYHRKRLPRLKHPEMALVPESFRRSVLALCLLLRLAENMDKSHAALVQGTSFEKRGKEVVLSLRVPAECPLEITGLHQQKKFFKEIFGSTLQIEQLHTDALSPEDL